MNFLLKANCNHIAAKYKYKRIITCNSFQLKTSMMKYIESIPMIQVSTNLSLMVIHKHSWLRDTSEYPVLHIGIIRIFQLKFYLQDCICEKMLCHRINTTLNSRNKSRFFFYFCTTDLCHNIGIPSEFGGQCHISAFQMKEDMQVCLMAIVY
jgi:hypothetical protein